DHRRREPGDDLRQGHRAAHQAHAAVPGGNRHHQHVPGVRGGLRDDPRWSTVRYHHRRLPHLPRGFPALQLGGRLGTGHRAVPHHFRVGRSPVPVPRPERGVLMAAAPRFESLLRDMSHPVRPTRAGAVVILLILIVLSLAALIPLYWMFATSLTPSAMTVRLPPELIPSEPTLDNYRAVL